MTETPSPTSSPATAAAAAPAAAPAGVACPACGVPNEAGATFCEACGADLEASRRTTAVAAGASPQTSPALGGGSTGGGAPRASASGTILNQATPVTAPVGEESPLDVGWTGAVASTATQPTADAAPASQLCTACGIGHIVDGYCDNCGSPPPNPRDHFTEAPAAWVGGVCDIGKRHSRNEDAMALSASEAQGSRAVLVVCDGVSNATDSHIASLAAAKAARVVLDQPLPKGVGTADAWVAGAGRAIGSAVQVANEAVRKAVETDVPNPPSCTFVAAVIENGVVVAGNVGDSRAYWLPDSDAEPARQLGIDDSWAQERMTHEGIAREEAENGPQAHSITRWLGIDSPDDLTPHLATVTADETARGGWLAVVSDGLWNYCSPAEDVRKLLRGAVEGLDAGVGNADPVAIAQGMTDFANEQGGRDNITVALARLAGQGSNEGTGAGPTSVAAAPQEGNPTHG